MVPGPGRVRCRPLAPASRSSSERCVARTVIASESPCVIRLTRSPEGRGPAAWVTKRRLPVKCGSADRSTQTATQAVRPYPAPPPRRDWPLPLPRRSDDGDAGLGPDELELAGVDHRPAGAPRPGVKVAALGFIPQNRRPSSAMAWLLLVYLIPFVGLLLFFVLGQHDASTGAGAGSTARSTSSCTSGSPRPWHRRPPTWSRSGCGPSITMSQNLGTLPLHLGQRGRAVLRLRGVDRRDDRRGRQGAAVRQRGVLHHGLGRRDRPVLRGAGGRASSAGSRCGCSSTTSARGASPATRTA